MTLTIERRNREYMQTGEASQTRQYADPRREPIATTEQPLEMEHALSENLLLVGEPGAGKSTLLRWLAVTFAKGCQRNPDRLGPSADGDRLPVLVELGRLPNRYLNPEGGEIPSWLHLLPRYIIEQEAFFGIPPLVLEQALVDGRCLLLFDGLDEVADRRVRARLARSVAELARLSPNNRVIVGSRPAGVSESESALQPTFQRCQIARFTPDDVQRFFSFWYALDRTLSSEQQRDGAKRLYTHIQEVPKVLELATTPLLSTILVLLWRNEGELPGRRVELYEHCCRNLIEHWEHHHDVAYQGIFAQLGWERHLRLLAPLAYTIHSRERQTSASREELLPVLVRSLQSEGLCRDDASATLEAEQFLRTLGLRSGLLQHLGEDRYGFPHQTFQEYLTARFIAAQRSPAYIDLVMAHLHESWWQEVHLLTIGYLGSGGKQTHRAVALLLTILGLYRHPWRIWHSISKLGTSFPQVQLDRCIAWTLGREFALAAKGYAECAPDVRLQRVSTLLTRQAVLLTKRVLVQAADIATTSDRLLEDFVEASIPLLATIAKAPMGSRVILRYLRLALSQRRYWHRGWVRILALLEGTELSKSDKETVVEILLSAFRDWYWGSDDPNGRVLAARYLGRFGTGDKRVASTLLLALDDPVSYVRGEAARSLGILGGNDEAVVKALFHIMHHDTSFAVRSVAWALARLGTQNEGVVKAILEAVHNSDGDGRCAAIWSLGYLGASYQAVVPTLLQAAHDLDWRVRSAATESLAWLEVEDETIIMDVQVQALQDEHPLVHCAAIKGLEELATRNKTAIPALCKALYAQDSTVQHMAVESLEQLAASNPAAVVDTLLQALCDPACPTRHLVVESLGKMGMGNQAVVHALLQVIHEDVSLRHTAIKSLGELRADDDEVVKIFLQALDDPDMGIQIAATESQERVGRSDEAVVDALLQMLLDQHWQGRGNRWNYE